MKKLYNYIISHFRTINSKQWIEQSMTEKHGADWLDQCITGLKNPEVREALRKALLDV